MRTPSTTVCRDRTRRRRSTSSRIGKTNVKNRARGLRGAREQVEAHLVEEQRERPRARRRDGASSAQGSPAARSARARRRRRQWRYSAIEDHLVTPPASRGGRSGAGRRPRASGAGSRGRRVRGRASSAQPDRACRSAATCSLASVTRPARSALRDAVAQGGRQRRRPTRRGSVERDLRGRSVAAAERLRRALGDDPPCGDDRDAVGQALGLLHVVGGQEDGLAELAQTVDDLPGGAARRRVEARCRLVEEDQLGIADQRERDVQPAALAARQRSPRAPRPARAGRRARASRPPARGAGSSRRTAPGTRAPSARARAADSCRTMPRRARHSAPPRDGSAPSTRTPPPLGLRKPSRISTVVVLPAPLGPRKAKISPRRDLEVDAAHGLVVAIALVQAAHRDGEVGASFGGGRRPLGGGDVM